MYIGNNPKPNQTFENYTVFIIQRSYNTREFVRRDYAAGRADWG
jgi:hypothetical protein